MTTPSFKTAEALDAAWFAPAGNPLARVDANGGATAAPVPANAAEETTRTGRRVLSRVLRVARDLAIGLAVIAAIPLTVIEVSRLTVGWNSDGIRDRLVEVERLRPLMAPVDATISPEAAGAAMRRLLPVTATPTFLVPADRIHEEPWQDALPAGLFDGLRSTVWNGPDATKVVAAAKGFSEREREWLKAIAESPMWQDVDVVARAARVDVLGQRFELPFRDDAWSSAMPIPQFMRSRKLAYAGVARAAYYVSIGDRVRAESALRAIVSFGFASLDDGIYAIEGMMGRVVLDAGRDGLRQLYSLDGRSELLALTNPMGTRAPLGPSGRPPNRSAATVRDAALRNVNDPALPRTFRFEQLSMLSWSTCGDVRSVLLGPSDEVQQAFDVARSTLAQSEAERQYVDLLKRNVSAVPIGPASRDVLIQIVQGAAVVTSTVTGNPRIASCTRAVIGEKFSWR